MKRTVRILPDADVPAAATVLDNSAHSTVKEDGHLSMCSRGEIDGRLYSGMCYEHDAWVADGAPEDRTPYGQKCPCGEWIWGAQKEGNDHD